MSHQLPLDVPADLQNVMRAYASRSAFLAAMLDVIRRKGGLTQNQLDMVRTELAAWRALESAP